MIGDDRTYYKPGLVFLSKAAGCWTPLIQPQYHTYPDGNREQIRPFFYADFGESGGHRLFSAEQSVDDEGRPLDAISVQGSEFNYTFTASMADIRGGVFNLDEYAARVGLTDEEREQAARKLVKVAEDPRETDIWLYQRPVPEAPWEGFDETHHHRVVEAADTINKLQETLDYLRYMNKWPGVQDKLVERIKERQQQSLSDEALSAA